MKKILAFVLAIVMVLGMATVGFAADPAAATVAAVAANTAATSHVYLVDSATYKAADLVVGDIVVLTQPSVTMSFVTNTNAYKAAAVDTQIGTVTYTLVPGTYYIVGKALATDSATTVQDKVQTPAVEPTFNYYSEIATTVITDNYNNTYDATLFAANQYVVKVATAIAAPKVPTSYFVTGTQTVDYDAADSLGFTHVALDAATQVDAALVNDAVPTTAATMTWALSATDSYKAPVVTAVDAEVIEQLYVAYNNHNDTVNVNLNDTSIFSKTISVADWNWLLNTYKGMPSDIASTYVVMSYTTKGVAATYATSYNKTTGQFEGAADLASAKSLKEMGIGDWWNTANWQYLSMNFKFMDGTTLFYIAAADIDYTWNTAVNFTMDDGLSGYIKTGTTEYTSAEMYNFIRALTGDTKNPYTFGWTVAKAGVEVAVPTMTVSYVIPQQWINVYGHKNLALWVYSNTEKCEVCGQTHQMGHVLTTTTLEATTQTQRIEFTTNYFYRTLVLSQTAVTATEPTDDNPNTGANDIVNVAIVFAVISLVAAGAFVFSKQR